MRYHICLKQPLLDNIAIDYLHFHDKNNLCLKKFGNSPNILKKYLGE